MSKYKPQSELLLVSGHFELRFTPHLTNIFVLNTANKETSFPVRAYTLPGSKLGNSTGVQKVRAGVIYPQLNSKHPDETDWKRVPAKIHRQVVRILEIQKEKRRTAREWARELRQLKADLNAV